MTQLETLANKIMNECQKNGEPVTLDEALDMARMELNEKANHRYEKSDSPRKKTERKKKEDPIKREIIASVAKNLSRVVVEEEAEDYSPNPVFIENPEREITFILKGESYSLILTKHRPKK